MPTFAFNLPGRTSEQVAVELGSARDRGLARRLLRNRDHGALGLEGTGAVRAGFVHYNTAAEVDRLLAALDELC